MAENNESPVHHPVDGATYKRVILYHDEQGNVRRCYDVVQCFSNNGPQSILFKVLYTADFLSRDTTFLRAIRNQYDHLMNHPVGKSISDGLLVIRITAEDFPVEIIEEGPFMFIQSITYQLYEETEEI